MKKVWKRSLSLLLSGVLLLGNVPVQALATEEEFIEELVEEIVLETEPKATEPQEVKTQETKPQEVKAAAEVKVTDSVKSSVTYDITVNGTQITSENCENVLGNEMVSYDPVKNVLTLKKATISAGTDNAIEAEKSLTIILEGENYLTAMADNKAAIWVKKSLTIQGSGSLEAVSENGTAILVDGYEDEEGTKYGLTVSGDVVIEANTKNETDAAGIQSPFGVVIGEDAEDDIHLKTNKVYTDTENPVDVYTLSDGYVKVGDADFAPAEDSWTPESVAFEFVSTEHLKYTKTVTEHSLVCNENCELTRVTVLTEDHSKGKEGDREAGCGLKAKCSVCGEYGGELAAHLSPNTSVIKLDNKFHKEIWDCCEAEKSKEEHSLNYSSEGNTITATCTVNGCGATGTATLTAENAEYTGAEYAGASYGTPDGVLTGETPVITYTNNAVEGDTAVETAPTAIGEYTAYMSVGDKTVEKQFSITKISLANANVKVSGGYTYTGSAQEPEAKDIEVKLNDKLLVLSEHYIISGCSNNTKAGTATVTITAAENSDYTGSATGEFEIQAKKIEKSDVKLGPQLTYTGAEQEQTVVANAADVTFEVTGNKNTDAGDYKLTVKGTGNYCDEITLDYTIKKAEAVLELTENQIIAGGTKGGDFVQPKYMVGQTELEGTFTYSMEGAQNVLYAGAKSFLQELNNGDEREITFVFAPKNGKNYTCDDNFTGKFKVTVKTVRFAQKDKSDLDKEALLTKPELIYGDVPVNTDAIYAFVDGKEVVPDAQYTVIYTKVPSGTGELADPLDVGSYTFVITYTGDVDGIACENYPVYSSSEPFEIKAKPIVLKTTYEGKNLTEIKEGDTLKEQKLIDKIEAKDPKEVKVEYWVNNEAPSEQIPQRAKAGRYKVYYRVSANNYETKDAFVWTTIQPQLTVEYGENLSQVKGVPNDGKWHWALNGSLLKKEDLSKHTFDEIGENKTFQMVYEDSSAFNVTIQVNPKKLTPTVTLNDKDGYIHYDDRLKNNLIVKDGATGDILKYGKDYTLGYAGTASGLKYQYTVKDVVGGNYEIKETSIVANLYRQSYNTLVEANFPKDDLAGTANSTLEKVKTTLTAKVKATDYPETAMKYFSTYVTKIEDKTWVEYRNEGAFPPDGVDYVISYAHLNATKNDKFKVSVMDTFGKNAGKEANVVTSTKTDEGLKIHLKQYAAVCVAKQVKVTDATKETEETKSEYKVSVTSSSYGTVKFSVGNETTKRTSANVKVGETLTITATPNSNYAVTKVQYTYKDGATTKLATLTQNSSGEYKMKMPAKDITFRATFAKKTSSSKNPYSGDTSNIYLWITVLALSAAAIVALMAFWFKKRKK